MKPHYGSALVAGQFISPQTFAVWAVVLLKMISHWLVLFPLSIHVGQATVPWLMAHDRRLYVTILEHRPPLSALAVAAVQPLFGGDTLLTVRVLHLVTILATIILIYEVARRLLSETAGVLAVIWFALLESSFANVAFYFEVAQGLMYIGVAALLLRTVVHGRPLFLAGVLLGASLLTKQQAVVVIIWVLVWVGWRWRSLSWEALVGAGILVPLALVALYFARDGRLDELYYWTVTFNVSHGVGKPGMVGGDFVRRLILSQGWLLPFALTALHERRGGDALIVGIGLAAQTVQFPRAGDIHAAAALPFASIAFGVVIARLIPQGRWRTFPSQNVAALGVAAVICLAALTNVVTSYIPSPAGEGVLIGASDLKTVSAWLLQREEDGDTMYVLPSSDSTAQLHVLTGMLPPGTWAPGNQFLHSEPFVNERLLAEWFSSPPTWLIWFPGLMAEADSEPYFQPLLDFLHEHYDFAARLEAQPFYGEALIYRYRESQ
ncbi:MAG TPA: glycosyltransferase family 39 protein [Bellilinea sp.]|nr:glycosyltransferase family 39 protein [Bellilinea sp.]